MATPKTTAKPAVESQETIKAIDPLKREIVETVVNKLKKGDVIQIMNFVEVIEDASYGRPYEGEWTVNVQDLDGGRPFAITGDKLISRCLNASQGEKTVSVTRTEAIKILTHAYNQPFKVVFIKENGEKRELIGRLIGEDEGFGRSAVDDLSQPIGKRYRLVDHRTLQAITIGGICYQVRSK